MRAFTVRDAELAALDALVPEPARHGDHCTGPEIPVVCAVTGPGGVGKTAEEARASWRQALGIFTDLHHPVAAGVQARLARLAA